MEEMATKPDADIGLRIAVAGKNALPAMKDVKFVQREPAGQILVGKDLSANAIGEIYRTRELMGTDLYGGGSTLARANLGDAFFGKELVGDIDTWTKAKLVEKLWKRERDIIKSEIPNVDKATDKKFAQTFLNVKKKLPEGSISKPGSEKPIIEIHSLESWPHVANKENVATLKTVGGYTTTGMSTNFIFKGKLSATFNKQMLTQSPGGKLKFALSQKHIKHWVGASAIAKEGASLHYGRDSSISGMNPSYTKGMALERFSTEMDNMLSKTKGEKAKVVKEYQGSIKVNPLELKETKTAKTIAAIREGKLPLSKIFGVGLSDINTGKGYGYPAFTFPKATPSGYGSYIASAATIGLTMRMSDYGSVIKGKPPKNAEEYPFTTPSKGVVDEYPVPKITATAERYPDGTTTMYPTAKYPVVEYPTPKTPYIGEPPVYTPTKYPPIEYPTNKYPPTEYPPTKYYPPIEYPPTEYPPTKYPPPSYPPKYPPRIPHTWTPPVYPPWTPIIKKDNDGKGKNRRKKRKSQPYREVIPIERMLFTGSQAKTQDFEKRYTILKGTNQVVGGLVPPEFSEKFLSNTQNYRATRGKGWIEAQYVNEVPKAPLEASKVQTYQRERVPEPALGVSRRLHTIFKGTRGTIDTKAFYNPPVKLLPVGIMNRRKNSKKGWLL
jgi:hypothetical protein